MNPFVVMGYFFVFFVSFLFPLFFCHLISLLQIVYRTLIHCEGMELNVYNNVKGKNKIQCILGDLNDILSIYFNSNYSIVQYVMNKIKVSGHELGKSCCPVMVSYCSCWSVQRYIMS